MTKQDIDLQKIQVLESSYQGWFNFKASLIAGVIIGVFILLATTQYEKIFPLYAVGIGDLVVMIFGLYAMNDMRQKHEKHVSFISGLIQKIDKGERLDSIEKLREEQKNTAEKKKQEASKESKRANS